MADETKPDAQSDGEGTEAPKPFTHSDFDKAFNKAFSAREKRSNESLAKFKSELMAEIKASLTPKPADDVDDVDDEEEAKEPATQPTAAAPTPPSGDRSVKRKLREMQKRQEATERELHAERAARAEEAAKLSKQEERVKLSEALQMAGVNPEQMRSAISLLHGDPDTRRVRRSTDGVVVFVDDDGEEVELTSGIKVWSESKEGKFYKPPRGVQGSGAEPTKGPPKALSKNSKPTKEDVGRLLMSNMLGMPVNR